MARPRKYTPREIMEWNKLIRHLTRVHHLKKKQACKMIQGSLGVPARTVANYTSPSRYRFPSQYQRYPSQNRRYPSQYNSPEYDLRYKHLIRHLDTILPTLYNGNPELTLPEISERIETHAGIRMQEGTLEKLLARYEGKPRGPPVLKTESGSYKLNPSYHPSSRNVPAYQGNGV